jgi:hypothetical protein
MLVGRAPHLRIGRGDALEVDLAEEPGERDPRVACDADGRMSSRPVPVVHD